VDEFAGEPAAEIGGEGEGGGVAAGGVFGEGFEEDGFEVARDGVVQGARGAGFVVQDLVQEHARVAAERQFARDEFVEHDAERVYVAPRIHSGKSPAACSGDMYAGVPSTCPSSVTVISPSSRRDRNHVRRSWTAPYS
jgi:hypothetical protein